MISKLAKLFLKIANLDEFDEYDVYQIYDENKLLEIENKIPILLNHLKDLLNASTKYHNLSHTYYVMINEIFYYADQKVNDSKFNLDEFKNEYFLDKLSKINNLLDIAFNDYHDKRDIFITFTSKLFEIFFENPFKYIHINISEEFINKDLSFYISLVILVDNKYSKIEHIEKYLSQQKYKLKKIQDTLKFQGYNSKQLQILYHDLPENYEDNLKEFLTILLSGFLNIVNDKSTIQYYIDQIQKYDF